MMLIILFTNQSCSDIKIIKDEKQLWDIIS